MTCHDLLVFGDTGIDYFYTVNKIPALNGAAEIYEKQRFYGGMGANTAVFAKSMGLNVGLFSVIGSDAMDYMDYLKNHGIKLYLKGIFGETTEFLFFKGAGEISFFNKGVADKIDELKPDPDLIKDSKVIYMSRTYLNLQKRVSRYCRKKFLVYNPGYGTFNFGDTQKNCLEKAQANKKKGTKTISTRSRSLRCRKKIPEDFYRIIKNVNVLILNEHEMKYLKERGFEWDFKLGPEAFLITKGVRGCTIHAKNESSDIPVFKTKVVDTSGAGDAFNAGLIAGHNKGMGMSDCARMGNAAASFAVEKWGCQTNLPSLAEVTERFEKLKNLR